MDGIVSINKPLGWSSFKTVDEIKKISGCSKAGHAGTLDPQATGVLIILLGEACKLSEIFLTQDKTYLVTVALGYESNTWDSTGEIKKIEDVRFPDKDIKNTLLQFKGRYAHRVPELSAKKHHGETFYRIKRRGRIPPQRIQESVIKDITLHDNKDCLIKFSVVCTSGTYVRTLASDIAQKLGTRGYLKCLVRTGVGNFNVADSVEPDKWNEGFIDIHKVMLNFPYVVIEQKAAQALSNGIDFCEDSIEKSSLNNTEVIVGVFSPDFKLKALARKINGKFKLKRVFNIV